MIFKVILAMMKLFEVISMNSRAMLLLGLATLAIILYAVGFTTHTYVVIVLAACVELWFWFKLLVSDKHEKPPSE